MHPDVKRTVDGPIVPSFLDRIKELEADLAAQIAGHQETASQGAEGLMRANTATAKLDEAEARARKYWQAFRDLRLDIIGHGRMCRDCADFDGRCQGNGQPCDPDEAVKEQIANWRISDARIKALAPVADELDKVGDWINDTLPIPTRSAIPMLGRVRKAAEAIRATNQQESERALKAPQKGN